MTKAIQILALGVASVGAVPTIEPCLEDSEVCATKGSAMLQKATTRQETTMLTEREAKGLCHGDFVEVACKLFARDEKTASWDGLAEHLSVAANALKKFKGELKLEGNTFECQGLCETIRDKIKSMDYKLPKSSNKACVCSGGKPSDATCGVDVDESDIQHEMHDEKGAVVKKVQEKKVHPKIVKPKSGEALGKSEEGYESGHIQYSVLELLERIANTYHVFPAIFCPKIVNSDGSPVALLESSESRTQKLATAQTKAKAWVTFANNQFVAGTASDEQKRWFGGSGSKSVDQIKTRIRQELNFVATKVSEAVLVIASAKHCSVKQAAMVSAYNNPPNANRRVTEAYQTSDGGANFKKCGADVSPEKYCDESCVLDKDNNYIIYFCPPFFGEEKMNPFPEKDRIKTMVHEMVHHNGPGDFGKNAYDHNAIKKLKVDNQLENAENYAALVADIVDGECVDQTFSITQQQHGSLEGQIMDKDFKPVSTATCAQFGSQMGKDMNLCGQFGKLKNPKTGKNANSACCACGGGNRQNALGGNTNGGDSKKKKPAPSPASPTQAPATQAPTRAPTRAPPTVESTKAPPTPDAPNAQCVKHGEKCSEDDKCLNENECNGARSCCATEGEKCQCQWGLCDFAGGVDSSTD